LPLVQGWVLDLGVRPEQSGWMVEATEPRIKRRSRRSC